MKVQMPIKIFVLLCFICQRGVNGGCAKANLCCKGRKTACKVGNIYSGGHVCYCDEYCSTKARPDCCSDYKNHCKNTKLTPFCAAQNIKKNGKSYSFKEAMSNEISVSKQLCESTNVPLAFVRCIGRDPSNKEPTPGELVTGAYFDKRSVQEIECGITLNNVGNISATNLIRTIEALTSQSHLLNEDNLITGAEVLSKALGKFEQVTRADLISVANIVSNLATGIDSNPSHFARATMTKSSLLATLNYFAASVVIPIDVESGINVATPDINIQAFRIAQNSSRVDDKAVLRNLTFDLKTGSPNEAGVSVSIPVHLLTDIARSSKHKAPEVYVTLIDEILTSNQNLSKIVSVAASASNTTSLQNPIYVNFHDVLIPNSTSKTANPFTRRLSKAEISFWDFETLQWKRADQCHQSNSKRPEYQCKGFASYAVLFTSKEVPSIFALTTVGYIGSVMSIIFLLATIFVYLKYKHIRKKPTTITLVNVCVCLVGIYFFYVIGVGRAKHKLLCDVMTFFLHYFTLACLTWMTVNAVQMYQCFVQFSYSLEISTILIYILTYGLPFLVASVNIAVTVGHLDKFNHPEDIFFESLYRYKHVCWLQSPSLIWGFLVPFALMLAFNYAIFVVLLRKIFFRKQKVKSTAKDIPVTEQLFNAITMVTMMGLSWIFGYFLLLSDNLVYQTAMQWLFALTNTFQGVLIFFLFCVRHEKIRRLWLPRKFSFPSMSTSNSRGFSPSSVDDTRKLSLAVVERKLSSYA